MLDYIFMAEEGNILKLNIYITFSRFLQMKPEVNIFKL